MYYLARQGTKVTVVDANDADTAGLEIVKFLNNGWTLYRIVPQGNGTFLLVPQEPVPGSEVTTTTLVSLSLQDAS